MESKRDNALSAASVALSATSGHGREHTGEIYAILNLLSFQMYGVMPLLDERYKKARGSTRRRDEFFFGPALHIRPAFISNMGIIYRLCYS
jgi:hypothetical protein